MQMHPYVSFKGDCEAAFQTYERCLGAQTGALFRYGGSPAEQMAPAGWSDKIMHGSITVGNQVIMGADVAPERYEAPHGFSLSLQLADPAEAERIFRELSDGGTVVMPLEKTFWAARFGMLVDRFGIPWMINCDEAEAESV